MQRLKAVTFFAVLMLTGCASYEGTYTPGCIAYAGDTVSLTGTSFVWDRFTDQVEVGDNGEVKDAFPDFPKRGTYRVDGPVVQMQADSGSSPDDMFLHQDAGRYLLLTAKQNASWRETGNFDDCVLTQNDSERSN